MPRLPMLLANSVVWRVLALLGTLLSMLATEAVAFPSGNATHVAGVPAVNNTDLFRDSGQVLTIPLKRVNHRGIATPSIARRFFKTEVFGVYGAAYLAELTIGTSTGGDQQVIAVLIDTGSFEMWVNPNCTASNVPDFCKAFGHYDPALSSTSEKVNNDGFSIKYGSGHVMGPYYKDDIYISGARIRDQQFGVANSSELVWFGIMGLGHGQGNGFIKYPLIIDSLAAQGLTNTKLFSMDLGRQTSPAAAITGEMVFGGVDTNNYAGLLKKVPTDPSDPHYKITLSSLAHRAPGAKFSTPFADSSLPLPLIVDSGTTLSLLPEPLVSKLAAQFPGAQPDGAGGYRVNCAYQNQTGTVDFEFLAANGTVTINIAYSDFIWNSGGDCFLGAWFSRDVGTFILGDSFLRGAYIAFDQTNNALFMSNRLSCGNGESNLVAVPAGPDAAANIPGSCAPVSFPPPAPASSLPTSATLPAGTASNATISPVAPPATITVSLSPVGTPTSPSSAGSLLNPSTTPSAPPSSSPATAPGVSPLAGGNVGDQDPNAGEQGGPGATRAGGAGSASGHTITDTITRTIVYTATSCPETVRHCPLRDHVATRYETVVTTYCPGREGAIDATPAVGGDIYLPTQADAAPAITHPAAKIDTPEAADVVTTADFGGGVRIENDAPTQGQGQEQGGEEEGEGEIVLVTTTYPTVTTYAITSCGAGDGAACAVGRTTTRAVTATVVKTMRVVPVPTSPALWSANGSAAGGGDNGDNAASKNATEGKGVGGPGVVPVPVSAAPGGIVVAGARCLGVVAVLVWGVVVLL